MKRILIIILFSLFLLSLKAAEEKDKFYMKSWNIIAPIGLVDSISVDTLHLNFHDKNPVDLFSVSNSFNANLGSPIQTNIYSLRPEGSPFLFSDVYYPYITKPQDVLYYNSQKPISYISYNGGVMENYRESNKIDFLFTANLNKRINIGTTLKYIDSDGKYANQAATRFTGTFFASYSGKRYEGAAAVMLNNMKNYESGGLLDPEEAGGAIDIAALPVRLAKGEVDAYSKYRYNAFVYNHNYKFGFNRTVISPSDSIEYEEFVPVTRISHKIELSDYRKQYLEKKAKNSFYDNGTVFNDHLCYFSDVLTRDTAALQEVSNTVSVSIEEEFNKWLKFGLVGFLKNDIQRYTIMQEPDTVENVLWHRTKIGGVLSKHNANHFKYSFKGELDLLGQGLGDFNLEGELYSFFKIWKDSIVLKANGFSRAETPSFFLQKYRSNHFEWTNDFSKTFKTQIGGSLSVPMRNFELTAKFENIGSYVYFDEQALPKQHKEQIQVLSLNLKQDFRLWRLHLDNNVYYQVSSNQAVLPLAPLVLFHNLYYLDTWFKVLKIQLGADLRFHTGSYLPAYMPATGRFYRQDDIKIGNYPLVNAYVNCQLKQVRFFIKAYHINNLFMDGQALSMPNYPLNPMQLKIGVSWIFYD